MSEPPPFWPPTGPTRLDSIDVRLAELHRMITELGEQDVAKNQDEVKKAKELGETLFDALVKDVERRKNEQRDGKK